MVDVMNGRGEKITTDEKHDVFQLGRRINK
jgi:hypothetical protein